MLCTIKMGMELGSPNSRTYMIEVPDELFMRHMMMYGDFKPAQLSNEEYRSCSLLGLRDTMKYVGPASNRKDRG